MSNWKTKTVVAALALSIMVPGVAMATSTSNAGGAGLAGKIAGMAFPGRHFKGDPAKQQEMQQKLLELVQKYTPESLSEWQEALAEQEKLRQSLPSKEPRWMSQLTDGQKAQLKEVMDRVRDGQLTREQAREELAKLGLDKYLPEQPGGPRGDGAGHNLLGQLMKAASSSDEAKIKELLPQALQMLKERNQLMQEKINNSSTSAGNN
ncbi:MAG: hypothetical protein ACUVTU_10155 [Desulfurispora sp.]|uniref:hypothetical protein n=1 Tax=Desulfurispora sp. TaxID=3014275 RepID=UPI00404B2A15